MSGKNNFNNDKDREQFKIDTKYPNSLLCGGIVSNDADGILLDEQTYRRYVGSVDSQCVINGVNDFTRKSIMYEIGLRGEKRKSYINKANFSTACGQSIKIDNVTDQELLGLHKRISNFDGVYEYMDMAGVAFQLGRCIAHYNNTGLLSIEFLRDGKAMSVRALSTAFDPVTSSPNSVFIPRLASTIMSPATFCALTGACNAYGSVVYSDMVEVDGNNSVVMTSFVNEGLLMGCFEGLRLLMKMYDNFGAGSVISLAFIRGLHCINTVVGHTDEGGFMRDILRSGTYCPPFGAVYCHDSKDFIGFPMPSMHSKSSICAVIDSILLVSAAGVALCDPGVNISGNVFSTVLTNEDDFEGDRSEGVKKPSNYGQRNFTKIQYACGQFFANYCKFLSDMFGLKNESSKAEMFLRHSLNCYGTECVDKRHLNFQTIAPFFWIEPSSLFKKYVDNAGLLGVFGVTDEDRTLNFFEKAEIVSDLGIDKMLAFKMCSPRRSGLIYHLAGHELNGLSSIIPWNFDDHKFSCIGGREDSGTKRSSRFSFDKYLWGRGQSNIFAPAECNYIGSGMVAKIRLAKMSDDFNIEAVHFPRVEEILSGSITYRASRPFRIPNAKISTFTREILKKRNNASAALEKASQALYVWNMTGGEALEPSNTEYVFKSIGGIGDIVDGVDESSGIPVKTDDKRSPPVGIMRADGVNKPATNKNSDKGVTFSGLKEEKGQMKNFDKKDIDEDGDSQSKNESGLDGNRNGTALPSGE